MKALAFMPAPIRELPWRMIVPVICIAAFSTVVLYSAAGGGMRWALPQGARFVVFLGLAIAMSRLRPEWIKQAAFPAYVIVLVLLVAVEALGFVGGGAQRWLDLGAAQPAAFRADEAGDRARLRPFLFAAAGARDPRMERALAGRRADRHSGRASSWSSPISAPR